MQSALSPRLVEVAKLVQEAKTNKEIAIELHLSPGTVKEYMRIILRTLELRNRTALAMWAARALMGLCAIGIMHGQTTYTMQIPSGAVNPGAIVTATVNIATAGTIKPAAVQLRLNFAAADISGVSATIGAAGAAASKTVSCNGPAPGVYKCIVSGVNTNLIGDGALLTYAITIAPSTTKTNTAISLTDDLGATVAGDVILIADVPFVTVTLVPSKCDLNVDGAVNAVDVQLALDQALEKTACAAADLDKDGRCTVNDVQRVINAVLGQGCRVD